MKALLRTAPTHTHNLTGAKSATGSPLLSGWQMLSVHLFFFIAAFLISSMTYADDSSAGKLSLDNAVSEALGTSPVVGKAKAAMEEQGWKKTEALSGFLPTLQITGNRLFVKQYEYTDLVFGGSPAHIPGIIPSTQASLNANLPVFDWFQNVNRYSAASKVGEAAKNEFDWTSFQVEEETRLRFAEALTALKLESVANQNVQTLTDHLDQVNKTRKGGMATQFDVLRVEVQLNEAQSELLKAKDDVVLARQKLLLTIGRDSSADDNRAVEGNLEVPDSKAISAVTLKDVAARKDLTALSLRADAADRMEAGASTHWLPKFSLGAQYTLYNNLTDGFTDWSNYRGAWNAGLFMTWTLFDVSSIARSKEAVYQKVQVEKQLQSARLEAPNDFEFWKRRYLYSAALYEAKLSDVKKGEESVRLAKASFKAGVRTNTEVLDAELDLFRARAGLVNSLKNCAEAKIKLELAVGHPIATANQPVTAMR